MSGVVRDGGIKPYVKNLAVGAVKGVETLGVQALRLASAPNVYVAATSMATPLPSSVTPSNLTQAQSSLITQTVVSTAAGAAAGPAMGALEGASMGAATTGPAMVGFSEAETGMINSSLNNLSGAGYDLSPLQQLIKADMPQGYFGISLSTPPTGAALGDGAFSSQEMLDHTLEEELLHVNQNLSEQTFGPGDAAAKETEVDAERKFPEPPQQ
jgi:hypothetical protein